MSASIMVQYGPDRTRVRSRTVVPSRGRMGRRIQENVKGTPLPARAPFKWRARPPCPWGMGIEGRVGRFCCWQILRTLASLTLYNPATPRRAPTAQLRTVRNPLRVGRLQRMPQASPRACLGQVAVGEGVTSCSQQRCVRQYAANRRSVFGKSGAGARQANCKLN